MPKSKTEFERKNSSWRRIEAHNNYYLYFFNLFMTNYEFEGVDKEANYFILKQYWENGKISAFNIKEIGECVYANFTEQEYNIYNFPIKAQPIPISQEWIVPKYFPKEPLEVNEDIVISYIQKDRMPIKKWILFYVKKLAQIEALIYNQTNSLKMPYLVAVSPEDKERMQRIVDNIMNDEEIVYLAPNDIQNIKVLLTQTPYLLDKLHQYKKQIENEVLTRLGINNVDIEKKEHLIVDEANANNELISDNADIYLKEMQNFCEACNEILGTNMSVIATSTLKMREASEEQEEQEDDSED